MTEQKMRANESFDEYKFRICSLKDVYGYTWEEITDIINLECNVSLSSDAYRKFYHKQLNLQSSNIDTAQAIAKEKIKLRDERIQINSAIRALSREETLKEIAKECVGQLAQEKVLECPSAKPIEGAGKTATLIISDWHYGLDVNLYYNKYNTSIAKDRVQKLLNEVAYICEQNKGIERLVVLNLGDMISGNIHLPLRINSRIDVITQTIEVSELLAEFLNNLSGIVPNINYYSVADNHSRLDPNKKESLQVESFTRIIDWWLKERLKNNSSITFGDNIYGDDIATFKVYDFNIIGVHGHKDKQRGIIQSLTSYSQQHWDMILAAHMHHVSANELNQTEFYCNGSLCGTDDYANDLRLHSNPSQLLIISTPDDISRCIYKIKLK